MRNSTRYKAASHLSIEGTLPATLPFENENKVLDDLRSGALFSISTCMNHMNYLNLQYAMLAFLTQKVIR